MNNADFTVASIRNKSLPASLFAEWAIDVYNHALWKAGSEAKGRAMERKR